jgi:hypothetical protein
MFASAVMDSVGIFRLIAVSPDLKAQLKLPD